MAAQNQTVETNASVAAFIKAIADAKRRKEFSTIIDLVAKQSGIKPKMWGPAIVGFGSYHYKYESGREGDSPLFGLASRVGSITLYTETSFDKKEELLEKLGKHKVSGCCLHIKKLEDIDMAVLLKLVKSSMAHTKKVRKQRAG